MQIDNSNLYATKQIEEAENRIRLSANSAAETEYQMILAGANEYFSLASYDRAKEKYNEAVAKRPTDPFPKQRLQEIDAILNPAIVKSTTLQPLGDPYDNSIMDGYAALIKADLERKNAQADAVVSRVEDVVIQQDELMVGKTTDQQETTNEIYLLRNKIALDEEESDLNRQGTVDVLRADEKVRDEKSLEDDFIEKADNIRTQGTLHEAIVSTEKDAENRDEVHMANTDVITDVNFNQAEYERAQAQKDALANVKSDQTLEDVKLSLAANDSERFDQRKEIEEQVNTLQVNASDVIDNLSTSKTETQQDTKKGIEGVKINAAELDKNSEIQAAKNDDKLKILEIEINNGQQDLSFKQIENSNEINKGVNDINLSIEENSVDRDLDRQATEAVIKNESREIDNQAYEDYNNETVKYLKNQNELRNVSTTLNDIDGLAEDKHAIKVQEVTKIDKNSTIVSQESNLNDEETRQKAKSSIVVANTEVELNSTTSTKKQEANSAKMSDVSKAKDADNLNQDKKDVDKHYAAQKQLSSVDNTKPEKVIIANTLGQEYPEGVSQESFTQSDENGLMTAIITRRVVVINGQGNVYVRTQTLNAITYTKNGQATTEYTWQRETQGPHLERHY